MRLAIWTADGIWENRRLSQYFLNEQNIDILLLQESHLNQTDSWKIRNYQILRTDRPGRKGGTAIIFKNHLPVQPITPPTLQSLEVTAAKLLT